MWAERLKQQNMRKPGIMEKRKGRGHHERIQNKRNNLVAFQREKKGEKSQERLKKKRCGMKRERQNESKMKGTKGEKPKTKF